MIPYCKLLRMDKQTIAVDEPTKTALGELKEHPRETYGDVIQRLIKWWTAMHPKKKRPAGR